MGNSQSNSINDNVKKIIEESATSSSDLKSSPVKVNTDDRQKNKFVNTETDAKSVKAADVTSSAVVPKDIPLSATSPEAHRDATSSAAVSNNMTLSATSDKENNAPKKITLDISNITKTPEASPKVKATGYSYAAEVSDIKSIVVPSAPVVPNATTLKGGENLIQLDNNIFQTSEISGGENEPRKSTEFNPESFFSSMQDGGMLGERKKNKEYKKSKIERYLSSDNDEEDGFDFGEATEGLDIDENEDTEDIKTKVKVLRAMVSRSKGKKGKKGSKKVKRVTEQSGGSSENSVSEYLNSTSSISTSDVRLISMNKMRKH
jgi:hypothetical protein